MSPFLEIYNPDARLFNCRVGSRHHYLTAKAASRDFDKMLNKPKDPNKTYILDLMRKKDNE